MASHRVWLICLFLVWLARASTAQPQVQTSHGMIVGQANGVVNEFLGIPYAAPPIDSLRWKRSIPPKAWTTILDARNLKPKCPQKSFNQGDTVSTIEGDEDCLYLNIWTPSLAPQALPVMVFIHGGGNQQGSAREITAGTALYDGKNLSERGQVVVVTIQYRLGALGFLVHPGLEAESLGTSGNYAVSDHLLALRWVQENIGKFGGDSGRVMIFGESAGGVNVGNLLVTEHAKGLFSRACIQSASANLSDYPTARSEGVAFVNAFAPSGSDEDKISVLRSIGAADLVATLESPLSGGIVSSKWKPVVDGDIFPENPITAIQSGNFNRVPLLIGSNADEVSTSAPAIVPPAVFRTLVKTIIPSNLEEEAFRLYPIGVTPEEAKQSYIQFLTDVQFTATTRRLARCVSQNQDQPVFRYFFTHSQSGLLAPLGAYHGIELFYVFNTWENSPLAIGPLFTSDDQVVQSDVLKYWTNFAHAGDPNGQGLTRWPNYSAANDCYLEIYRESDGSKCGLRGDKCDLIDQAVGFRACQSTVFTDLDRIKDMGIAVFPNPASTEVFAEGIIEDQFTSLSIYALDGKRMAENVSPHQIDISPYQPGIYLLHFIGRDFTKVLKLVKH